MGAVCCGVFTSPAPLLTPQERAELREKQIDAAEARSKTFAQGGGGDKLKAKSKALEDYEKKNKDLGGPNALTWHV